MTSPPLAVCLSVLLVVHPLLPVAPAALDLDPVGNRLTVTDVGSLVASAGGVYAAGIVGPSLAAGALPPLVGTALSPFEVALGTKIAVIGGFTLPGGLVGAVLGSQYPVTVGDVLNAFEGLGTWLEDSLSDYLPHPADPKKLR